MSVLVGLLLVLLLPSAAGAVALSASGRGASDDARDVSPDVLLARGLACGLATWLLGSGLLVRTVGLSTTSVWVWDAVVGAASLAVLLLPHHRTRLRAVLAAGGRRLVEVGGLTGLVFLPLGAAILRTTWSPLGSTPWYYYGLARQVAELGHLPATSSEFGTTTPFLNDYHLFTTGTAMLLVQDAAHPMMTVITVTLTSILLMGVGAVAVSSSLGVGRGAALLAVPLVVALGIAPIRAAAYRPETFGLALGLLMVALALDWLRHREWRSLAGAAMLAGALSQVHGIAALSTGVMVAAAALVALVERPRGPQLQRVAIALGTLFAAVVVAGLVFHEASGTVHAGGLVDRGGLGDPTWEFFRAARGDGPSTPVTNLDMVRTSIRELYNWQQWWAIPTAVLAALGLWRAWRSRTTRYAASFAVLSLLGILAVASVFMLGWQGYVPRRTGASRLVLETSMLGPPLLAVGLAAAGRASWGWRDRRLPGSPRAHLVVLLGVLVVCGLVSMHRVADYDDGQAPSRAELAVWRSLPVTGSDIVLANGYTEGFIPDVTAAQGLLDGRAPYTFDAQLHRANSLLRGAQAFFTDPAGNWSYLAQHHVTWIVVGDSHSYALATSNVWDTPASLQGLDGCSGLQRVTQRDHLTVYRVTDSSPRGCSAT
jgi:hypothetical protein